MSNIVEFKLLEKGKLHQRSVLMLDLENALKKLNSAYKYLEQGGLITKKERDMMMSEIEKTAKKYGLMTQQEERR